MIRKWMLLMLPLVTLHCVTGGSMSCDDSCIADVLADEASHGRRYDYERRTMVRELLEQRGSEAHRPALRAIAAMEPAAGEPQRLADLQAIRDALEVLALARDAEAAALNRRHVSAETDTHIVSTAIGNLRLLQDWSATRAIETSFDQMAVDASHEWGLLAAARFLIDSPQTANVRCERVRELVRYAETCTRCDTATAAMLREELPRLIAKCR